MEKFSKTCVIVAIMASLSACQSFSLDKERAAERRKQELCGDISTRNLPHCASVGTDLSGVTPNIDTPSEKTGILAEVVKTVRDDAAASTDHQQNDDE